MQLDPTLIALLSVVTAAGGAFGGVKVALNGTKESIRRVDKSVLKLDEKLTKHMAAEELNVQRLTRVETILAERLPNK